MLIRAVHLFPKKAYDVAIIGGGIHGAHVAREAALRGLSVALLERGDFNSATSANSHKIIHGGLRYLQHADFRRVRESVRERSALMRIAPHLVRPLPFLIPTLRGSGPGKLAMSFALRVHNLIAFDRNRGLPSGNQIPKSRVVSRSDCLELFPELDQMDLTGGALFYEGQVTNPDRFTLSVLQAAAQSGADLANYIEVVGFLERQRTIEGVKARDRLSGAPLEIRARFVVNCAGPWVSQILQLLNAPINRARISLLKAIVLVTRPLTRGIAVGVPSHSRYRDQDAVIDKGHRYLFITPWRDQSLVGTFQAAYGDDDPEHCRVTEQEVQGFLREVNSSLPAANLERKDVHFVYVGLIPRGDSGAEQGDAQLLKHSQILDHERGDGMRGLVSVVGVKFTTARRVAEQVVNVLLAKLGRPPRPSTTAWLPVPGGQMFDFDEFLEAETRKRPSGITELVLHHLIYTYGSQYREILKYGEEDQVWNGPMSSGGPVIRAEVLHGIRREMAQTLGDIVFRRTELGTTGHPGEACLEHCADILQRELGWDRARRHSEIDHVQTIFSQRS